MPVVVHDHCGSHSGRSSRFPSERSTHQDASTANSSRISQSIRMTKILVLVSTCFLILNAPAHICIISTKLYTSTELTLVLQSPTLLVTSNTTISSSDNYNYSPYGNTTEYLLPSPQEIVVDDVSVHLMYITILLAQYVSYASYSVNFFLYSFSGVSFRTTLTQWFRKLVKC